MSEESRLLFAIRVYWKDFAGSLTFCYRDGLKAQKAYEAIDEAMAVDRDTVEIADEFGNRSRIAISAIASIMISDSVGAGMMNNELWVAQARSAMHRKKLVDADPQLKAFLALQGQGGNIIMAGPGTHQ